MKSIFTIAIILQSMILFGQSGFETKPELIHRFDGGEGPMQLGLRPLGEGASDQGETHFPMAISTDVSSFIILDNVNGRIVSLKSDFSQLNIQKGVDQGLIRIWSMPGGYILGRNISGSNQNRGIVAFDERHGFSVQPLDAVLASSSQYAFQFVARVTNVLIFQNIKDEYVGIEIIGTAGKNALSLISEQDLFKKLTNIDNNVLFSGRIVKYKLENSEQLLSRSPQSLKTFFPNLKNFSNNEAIDTLKRAGRKNPQSVLAGILDSGEYYPLPNGSYVFYSARQLFVIGYDGTLLRYLLLPNEQDISVDSTICPSADGIVYYLHADFQNNSSCLYGLGPFPEVRIGYNGIEGIVNDAQVNLRDLPSTKSNVITQIDKSTRLRVLDKTDKPEIVGGQTAVWYKVRLWDRTEGWMFGSFVDIQK